MSQSSSDSLLKKIYGHRWGLFIGVDRYTDSAIGNLNVCASDVEAIYDLLTANGYEADRMRLLLAPGKAGQLPTRAEILAALTSVAQAAGENDMLLFYFSGHGIAHNGEAYLLPTDTRIGSISDTAIKLNRVKEIIQESDARAKVMILDACHSSAQIGKVAPKMSDEFIRQVFEEAEGMAILSSCKQNQRSYTYPKKQQSVFTYYLLEGLRGAADKDEKGFVTIGDINRYVTDKVKKWAVQSSRVQSPTLQYTVAGDIVLLARSSAAIFTLSESTLIVTPRITLPNVRNSLQDKVDFDKPSFRALLPSHIVEHCRQVLLKCDQFESYDSLQAFLITTELRMHRTRLPRCHNRTQQIDQTITYLSFQKRMNGEPAFPLFLARLRDRQDKSGALYNELDHLYKQVVGVASNDIMIPFVTMAMTKRELNDLMSEKIFSHPTVAPVTQIRFRQFRRVLEKMGISDLLPYYGVLREEWKPLIYPHSSMRQIVIDMFNRVNDYQREPRQEPRLFPQFLSNDFFSEDGQKKINTLQQLKQLGGVIIVDSISLFHPILAQTLSSSDLGSNKRVAVVVISPINTSTLELNQLIEQVVDSYMKMALIRFEEDFDKLCELGVGDLRTLKRWLYHILPETAKMAQSHQQNFDNARRMRQMIGAKPRGLHQSFFGRGGR